jgi:nucleotide-binding universal stress UspA family protein
VPVLAVPLRVDTPVDEVQRVLAAVGLDRATDAVATTAVSLARELAVPVMLLHVVPEVHAARVAEEAEHAALRLQGAGARAYLEELAGRLGGEPRPAIEVRVGTPAEQIAAAAAELPGTLLVLGTGATEGRRRPGTVAYRVLSLCDAPVLAVPG